MPIIDSVSMRSLILALSTSQKVGEEYNKLNLPSLQLFRHGRSVQARFVPRLTQQG
jgi:hypothetical protein